ncbi:DsbA family protein [uncultured Vibrio sp.]|uniref:DsbA family protein n=1 Tax=uncultured Vibrio sp. TaxID=114054 RepID=UPI0026141F78|nr:DsbA family protein [uncultured Vibrio sp.]
MTSTQQPLGAVSLFSSVGTNIYLLQKINSVKENLASSESVALLSDTVLELEQKSNTPLGNEQFQTFIMSNPEVILKSLAKQRFIEEQKAKAEQKEQMSSLSVELFNDNDPIMGNPNGKHVVVEFIDYNCGYCKRLAPVLNEFIAKDPEAKVIVKEYPIFETASSHYSALMGVALFYYKPELYKPYHEQVITQKKITKDSVDNALTQLGVPKQELKPYLDKAKMQIDKVRKLGMQLQVTGTPTGFCRKILSKHNM